VLVLGEALMMIIFHYNLSLFLLSLRDTKKPNTERERGNSWCNCVVVLSV